MADHNISINSAGDPDPQTLSCDPGDRITWTNNYSQAITTFNLPTCVAPQQSPAPIAVAATTRSFTVNAGKGTFDYDYSWPSREEGTRNGTIDVS